MNVISTWFYTSPPTESITYAQMPFASHSRRFLDVYWKNICCFFFTARSTNAHSRLLLFVNTPPPERVGSLAVPTFLRSLDVEVVELKDALTIAPPGFYKAWNSQFVLLDVLDWYSGHAAPEDVVLILDGDCVIVDDLSESLMRIVGEQGIAIYPLDYPIDHPINGLTRSELRELSKAYSGQDKDTEFIYAGGEFIALRGDMIRDVSRLARTAYQESVRRFERGGKHFNEEAHLLSHVYRSIGREAYQATSEIKRIWTNRAIFSNVDGKEASLSIWHLPAEKRVGFLRLFDRISKGWLGSLDKDDLSCVFRITPSLRDRVLMRVERLIRRLVGPRRPVPASRARC